MTAAATTSRTPRTPWGHSQSRSTTTPLGHPVGTPSVGQNILPPITPQARSPHTKQAQASSPSYFGLAPDADGENPTNSDAGGHARKNWKSPSSSIRSTAISSPKIIPHESNPGLAAFRKQSESKVFQLGNGNFGAVASPNGSLNAQRDSREDARAGYLSPTSQKTNGKAKVSGMDIDGEDAPLEDGLNGRPALSSLLDMPRRESPANLPTLSNTAQRQLSRVDEKHPRLSLPQHRVHEKSSSEKTRNVARARTLPSSLHSEGPSMITTQHLVEVLDSTSSEELLVLDVRVSPQYAQSRLRGALNLCIPTTLLKRPSFNTQKLKETFTLDEEREKFSMWTHTDIIILYDANSHQLKDASSAVNTVKKFTNEGWDGTSYIVRGGFQEISKKCPDLVEKPGSEEHSSNGPHLSIDSRAAGSLQVAGGLQMPATKTAANPFFGNIRQNMDLIGGVGQLEIKHPDALTHKSFKIMPAWLQIAADEEDKGKAVSDQFLSLEKEEQQRMKTALSSDVTYGSPHPPTSSSSIQIAGIEKGAKNRYQNILPFSHTRVKLQNVPKTQCDYINASHVKAEWSDRHYIAAQAPMPATFEDFWRVVWEQDARVIVMLSAESEGGQRKCHPYWLPDSYGPMKLKALSEKKVSLGSSTPSAPSYSSSSSSSSLAPDGFKKPLLTPQPERLGAGRRRATNPFGAAAQEAAREQSASLENEAPFVVVRHLALSHSSFPFEPIREVTQLQYSNWPDFGAPAHPSDLLSLIEHCNAVIRSYNGTSGAEAHLPAKPGERPVVVHCSAGCGRTGTFCTVDSVIDMLKRQRAAGKTASTKITEDDEMDIDSVDDWVHGDEKDLIAKTVEDFRLQRLSMVQTLKQYVLCYETILEWLVKEMPEKYRREALRRSYGG